MTSTPDRRRARLAAVALCLLLLAGGAAGAGQAAPAQDRLAAASADLRRGNGLAAEIRLREALAGGAPRAEVAARMGEALIRQGQLVKARAWLEGGDFAPAEQVYGLRMLGLLERIEGDLAAAARAYDRALAIDPRDAALWVDIGRLRYAGGEQMQAVEAVDRALALDPANVRALQFRGQLVRDQFGLPAALVWFEAGLKHAPDDLELLGDQAATLGELGRAREMLKVTRHMLAIAPRHPQALFLQAVLAARAGEVGLARALLDRTGNRLRDVPAAILLDGALNLAAGNPALAAEQLDRLARLQPANERARLLLARALADAGEHRAVVSRFAAAAARPDAPPYLLAVVARAHEHLGDRAAAAPLIDRIARARTTPFAAIAEDAPAGVLALRWRDAPDRPAAAVPYVRKLLEAGALAQAAQVAEGLRAALPGSNGAQALAGDVQLAGGNAVGALDRYRAAARVRLDDGLLVRLLEAAAGAGRAGEAAALADAYLASHPQSRTAARVCAALAVRAGNWTRARLILENLRERGGAADVRLLSELALAQLRDGKSEAALETARAAHALMRGSDVAGQALAETLAATGGSKQTIAALRARTAQEP